MSNGQDFLGRPPPYTSIRPEERLCRVTEGIYTALDMAYDMLEEKILLRSLQNVPAASKEPSREEAQNLARFEQIFRSIYFDKDQGRNELHSPLHRSLNHAVRQLIDVPPDYAS